jgi:Winged helix-turn-helix DNA-binding
MTKDVLIALRDAIDITLALPESVRVMLAQWLMPEAQKPNGRDLHSPASSSPPPAHPAKAHRRQSVFAAKTAERRLIEAMRDNPGLSVVALANAVGSSRSATGERLRQLAARGMVEKDPAGRLKMKREEPRSAQSERRALRWRRRADAGDAGTGTR